MSVEGLVVRRVASASGRFVLTLGVRGVVANGVGSRDSKSQRITVKVQAKAESRNSTQGGLCVSRRWGLIALLTERVSSGLYFFSGEGRRRRGA